MRGVFDAALETGVIYSDNIFATRFHEVDDVLYLLRPSLSYALVDGRNRLTARAQGEIARYADFTSENYDDWLVGLDGRYALSPAITFLGGAEYAWEHESRASPDAVNGLEPTEYERGYAFTGLLARSGAFSTRLAGTATSYDFSDVAALAGVINNDDRDRLQGELGARVSYRRSPGFDLFLQGAYDRRDYDSRLDDFGFARDSKGWSFAAGVNRTIAPHLRAEVFAGYMHQDYEDARLSDVGAFDVGALVDWTLPGGLGATLRLDRSIEETTLPGASAYVLTVGSLGLTGAPHARVQTGVRVGAAHYDYRGHPRSEVVADAQLWGRYWLTERIYAGLDYTLSQRSSNAAGYDFDENRFMASLGARLQPRAFESAAPLSPERTAPAGGYAGLLLAHGHLITSLDGPRGPGSNTADFGNLGASYGAVLGYGWTVGRVYFGAELEAFTDGPSWLHTADRVFSVGRDASVGLAARLGYLTAARDLLYTRAGVASATFDTDYLHATSDFSDDQAETGFTFGLGLEANAGANTFVRAEYVIASYKDYDVPTGGGRFDNFSNADGHFRIGGGIRFGRADDQAPNLEPTRFSGPYVGVQFGHGALASANAGVRSGGTAVDIDRASQGPVFGLLGGYGMMVGRLYAGGEISADISNMNWNIERDPNGRIYSAEHDYSLAASLRLGWRLSDSALIYGRIGAVRTRFEIPYRTSGTAVHSEETRTGSRFGAGLEIGLGERTRARVDYAVTEYDSYDLPYGEANSDSFDHSEGVMTIGLVVRP